ncbi:MAG: STAS domain-containing protein [Dokdonella sp.]
MADALRIERVDAAHVRVAGRLGFADAAAALERSDELLEGNASEVALDVGALAGIDSATLAVLLAWSARARIRGTLVRLTEVPAELRALAHLCDAEPLLGID